MSAIKQEERWTTTTVHTSFSLHDLPLAHRNPKLGSKSSNNVIQLPLLSLGWTFALSFARKPSTTGASGGGKKKISCARSSKSCTCQWTPSTLSFRQHDSKIPWGNTSMGAQISLATERDDSSLDISSDHEEKRTPRTDNVNSVSVGTIEANLARTPLRETRIATPYTLTPNQSVKLSLTVTIRDCPFPNGLFHATSLFQDYRGSDAKAQTHLARQSGDRVLNRSLTTGKLFDATFMSASTRSGKLHPTHASLSVLEKHIDFSKAKIGKQWSSVLAAQDDNSKHIKEILGPNDEEYELDSDYEDEDEDEDEEDEERVASSGMELGSSSKPCDPERDIAIITEVKKAENGPARSAISWALLERDRASDQDSIDSQPEKVVKYLKGAPHLISGATTDGDRATLVKFAAHRTWHAFLWYCYTGRVEFNKLKSQVELGFQRFPLTHVEDGPPSCSPKSMYRLAHLVGNNDLKNKALEAIRERMIEENILDETFSVFTSKYPDVRQVQLGILMKHMGSPKVKEAFIRNMKKFDEMPHAEPVILALCEKFASE